MKKLIFITLLCFTAADLNAQISIDEITNRQVPQWWQDAKFGIFIHWGVYAVPSYAEKLEYSEWYKSHMRGGEVRDFHERVYGADTQYHDFVDKFRAELFESDEWAELFKNAGAKYVVLTAKHMEGFTLWKSEIANELHGRKWNSVENGPKRDIVGELSEAVENQGLHMGLYYMLYEALTPAYLEDPQHFIDNYSIPQFKDLFSTYNPSIVWVDGSWQHTTDEYRSYELLQWLLDTMPNSEELVFNNRWGRDDYVTGHGTTEYTYMINPENLPDVWEECRGIGASFGFNRNERIDNYNTSQELILMLADVVSNGGNLLLNVGPTADGRIPIFKQDRLLDIGKWLEINGEAIYGTTRYKVSTQWSEGERMDIDPAKLDDPITDPVEERMYIIENFNILRLTVDPEEGQAVKEIMFTRKGDDVYAITPKFPRHTLEIRYVQPTEDTKVTLLGVSGELDWTYSDNKMVVQVPAELVLELPHQHAYSFKITNAD